MTIGAIVLVQAYLIWTAVVVSKWRKIVSIASDASDIKGLLMIWMLFIFCLATIIFIFFSLHYISNLDFWSIKLF